MRHAPDLPLRRFPAGLNWRTPLPAVLLLLAGCGIPGPPVPPTAHIPRPVEDLEASRSGDTVTLRFTPPTHYTDGSRIDTGRAVAFEIHGAYLGFGPPNQPANRFEQNAVLLRVLPSDAAIAFTEGGQVSVAVPIKSFTDPNRSQAIYAVRVVDAKGREAGFSNLAKLRTYPAPLVPREFSAAITEEGVRLNWTALRKENIAAGYSGDVLIGYRIFRDAVIEDSDSETKFQLLDTIPGTTEEIGEFIDRSVEWGKRYAYRIRSTTEFFGESVEGFDSDAVKILAEDTFPPAPPARLVAVGGPDRIDLSWDASPSADVTGYRIHRTRDGKEDPVLLPLEPQLSLTYTDTEVAAGAEYRYVVTAVDEAGNESPASNPTAAAAIRFGDADEENEE